jgi:hypothetical protein
MCELPFSAVGPPRFPPPAAALPSYVALPSLGRRAPHLRRRSHPPRSTPPVVVLPSSGRRSHPLQSPPSTALLPSAISSLPIVLLLCRAARAAICRVDPRTHHGGRGASCGDEEEKRRPGPTAGPNLELWGSTTRRCAGSLTSQAPSSDRPPYRRALPRRPTAHPVASPPYSSFLSTRRAWGCCVPCLRHVPHWEVTERMRRQKRSSRDKRSPSRPLPRSTRDQRREKGECENN